MNCRLIACGLVAIVACALSSGCGSTRWSDTQRTATEQLLISDAIDRAVSELDLGALAERKVFLESGAVRATVDSAYLISTFRQHLLAQGCILVDKLEEADYVVELRAGAVGTDRCDLLLGIPATKLPQSVPVHGVPNTIPELALATKTEQRAVTKIAVFAYNRHTGKLVWQSGIVPVESKIENLWVLGAGPFQRGTIYKGAESLGRKVRVPLSGKPRRQWQPSIPSVAKEMHYIEGEPRLTRRSEEAKGRSLSTDNKSSSAGDVRPTGHSGQSSPPAGSAVPPAPAIPPAPPLPPGPVGTSKHRGFSKTLDLTILDHMNTAPAAAQDSPDAQTAAQPATPSAATPSPATPSPATPSAATPSAATPGTETSQAAQPAAAPAGATADPASAAPPTK